MKFLPIIFFAATTLSQAVTIVWEDDSPTSFSVSITGTGIAWQGETVSPSGLWNLWTHVNTNIFSETGAYVSHSGVMTYLGTDDHYQLRTLPYNHFYSIIAPIKESVPWIYNDGLFGSLDYGWYGDQNPFTITAIPDIFDSSTWDWMAHWSASGEQVPDGGNLLIANVIIFLLPILGTLRTA